MTTKLLIEISHAEREAAAYNNAIAAARVGDRAAYGRYWAEFTRLHSERPAAVVETMEKRMGLA